MKSVNNEGLTPLDFYRGQSIAVGSEKFIEVTKNILGIRAKGRKKIENGTGYELREPPAPYNRNLVPENDGLRFKNTYYWEGS